MRQAYHTVAESNPPEIQPPNVPGEPLYRPPAPGVPGAPPDGPEVEPPLAPPPNETPGLPIPGPITL